MRIQHPKNEVRKFQQSVYLQFMQMPLRFPVFNIYSNILYAALIIWP